VIKKVISGSLVYGLAPYISRIVTILLMPMLTAHLSAKDFGIIGIITAYSSSISVFATLGFINLLYSSFYQYGSRYLLYWKRIYGILLIWTCIYTILQASFFYYFLPYDANPYKSKLVSLITISTLFSATSLIGNVYFQLNAKPLPIAIRTVFFGIGLTCINFYLVVFKNHGYLGYFEALAISGFLVNISYLPKLIIKLKLYPVFKFKLINLIKFLKITTPEIPHYYSSFLINSSNRIVMESSRISTIEIGKLSIVQQFSNIYDSFLSAINQALSPFLFNEIKQESKQSVKAIINLFFLIALLVGLFFSLWIKEIFSILIKNDQLKSAYKITVIMIMAQSYRPFYFLHTAYYVYFQKTISILKISLFGGLISLFGYLIIIPKYGIEGAALVYFISIFYISFSGFYFKFYKTYCNINYNLFVYMITPILLTVLLIFAVDLNLFYKISLNILLLALSVPLLINNIKQIKLI
jgi:O-antigen/teichoic acid export membrane protein